jgi:hypothetical protein
MWAEVTFNGTVIQHIDDEDGTLLAQFDWDQEPLPWRCVHCGDRFADEAAGADGTCMYSDTCTVPVDVTGHDCNTDHEHCVCHHDLVNEAEPFSWVNSAGIHFDEAKDQIDLSISLGDPRGAFVMSVFRLPNGQIRMEVPHPEDGFLHLPLRQIGTAVYIVNETLPEEGE